MSKAKRTDFTATEETMDLVLNTAHHFVRIDIEPTENDPFIKRTDTRTPDSIISDEKMAAVFMPHTLTSNTSKRPDDREGTGKSVHFCSPVGKDFQLTNGSTELSDVFTTHDPTDEVHFFVGRDLQLMIGQRSQLAGVSLVFKAMFEHDCRAAIQIPDVEPKAFCVLLRYAAKDANLNITADNVWEVLKASDKYDVETLTDTCFHFLSQQHPRRRRSHHLCSVLEIAHRLNYTQHHQQALIHVKQHAARLLKNPRALAELCPQCMLHIVTADDLTGVDEILLHDAVLIWAHQACVDQGNQLLPERKLLLPSFGACPVNPSWEELRAVAGDLAKHVRYLTLPKKTLEALRPGDPSSCLLTQTEKRNLLSGDGSLFPPTVCEKRSGVKAVPKHQTFMTKIRTIRDKVCMMLSVLLLCILGLFAILFLLWPIILTLAAALGYSDYAEWSASGRTSGTVGSFSSLATASTNSTMHSNETSMTNSLIVSSLNISDFNQTVW